MCSKEDSLELLHVLHVSCKNTARYAAQRGQQGYGLCCQLLETKEGPAAHTPGACTCKHVQAHAAGSTSLIVF
jgi:hypothetical protein